ncbi:hypothetical protein DPEC_G00276140 [Dallia pectoralis]|uniref:Uncharacterized protein n=1 Tax=Dallia pectoralis TaxID=75939 RepID=A0ACC2FLN2_DALPE|nr:hypothetical protein DPEC_G00276140 [Dallia pectoralis]
MGDGEASAVDIDFGASITALTEWLRQRETPVLPATHLIAPAGKRGGEEGDRNYRKRGRKGRGQRADSHLCQDYKRDPIAFVESAGSQDGRTVLCEPVGIVIERRRYTDVDTGDAEQRQHIENVSEFYRTLEDHLPCYILIPSPETDRNVRPSLTEAMG